MLLVRGSLLRKESHLRDVDVLVVDRLALIMVIHAVDFLTKFYFSTIDATEHPC